MSHRLPVKDGFLDWDCADALAIPDIVKSLDFIQNTGIFPVRLALLQASTREIYSDSTRPVLTPKKTVTVLENAPYQTP